ncbi:Protein/nucleic acid deglycase 3 [Sporomusa silvacetica DSM 10669]|uniref:Protein/nucleic acid deglycase 3 n=2 Tax=Sporomusa silvacetica TaxID=55504 RepID=A0ABZ3ISQ7_9FIRM|nr:chaperone protein YajL [Sporomusa silvacetica DSM 10669]
MEMKVLLHLADGFEEIEAISVVDILRRAGITIQMVSIMGKREVTGAHNITVIADVLYESVEYSDVDMIILPGGSQGTQIMDKHAGLNEQLVRAVEQGKWVAAICAAPAILGKLGLLKGKSATCYPGLEQHLQDADTSMPDSTIIDGNIITSRGPGTSPHFALTIVEVLKGLELANTIRQEMII